MEKQTDWRLRTNWRGKLILQRRVRTFSMFGPSGEWVLVWRDASTEDLLDYYARRNI
jgi:hypothetical protein